MPRSAGASAADSGSGQLEAAWLRSPLVAPGLRVVLSLGDGPSLATSLPAIGYPGAPGPAAEPRTDSQPRGTRRGTRSFVQTGVSQRSGEAQVARDARSPRAVALARPPLQSRVRCCSPAPAITLRGLRSGAAGRGEAMPWLWGREPRLVAAPSPPRLSPAASAAGSGSVTRAEIALPPALPIPLSSRLDLSRLLKPPPRPASSAGAQKGLPRKAQRVARVPFGHLCNHERVLQGVPAGLVAGVEKPLTGVKANCGAFPVSWKPGTGLGWRRQMARCHQPEAGPGTKLWCCIFNVLMQSQLCPSHRVLTGDSTPACPEQPATECCLPSATPPTPSLILLFSLCLG